jgi:uncharacterized pyridoxamine 5'-phosphate oxidase family protein/Pyruvate/2-oxoacid:ferredoxin oxidoreductase delta subunit
MNPGQKNVNRAYDTNLRKRKYSLLRKTDIIVINDGGNVMKNLTECLSTLREIKDIAFATVDAEGNPQVRIIDVMMAEEEALYFCTARGKSFYEELTATGKVAAVGLTKDWLMLRLNGEVTHLDDQREWIDRIFAENPAMNDVYPGDARYILDAFCIAKGTIEVFNLSQHPIDRKTFTFGGVGIKEKGFEVKEKYCTGCGVCRKQCPQGCISIKGTARINPEHCLHCGLCREVCPSGAIKRK